MYFDIIHLLFSQFFLFFFWLSSLPLIHPLLDVLDCINFDFHSFICSYILTLSMLRLLLAKAQETLEYLLNPAILVYIGKLLLSPI